jgi:hypothetical protein
MSSRFQRVFGPSRLFVGGQETIRPSEMMRSHRGFTAENLTRIRDVKAILFVVSNRAFCGVSAANTTYRFAGQEDVNT